MLLEKTVIPSVRELKFLPLACKSDSPVILLSNTDIGNLAHQIKVVHKYKKQAFVHLELVGGFAPDTKGLKLLKNMYHIDGVFTTNIQAGNVAKNLDLTVVYRFFLIDSRSLNRTRDILKKNNFDAIEVLPAYCAVQEFENLQLLGNKEQFIAGGFIKSPAMIEQVFNVGISGVTTSDTDLWRIGRSDIHD